MDPLTHALTGAALADALPMPASGRRGLAFAMFAAAVPDADMLPAFIAGLPDNLIPGAVLFDPKWMWLHRGPTHSLFPAVVFGMAAGWIFWRIGGRSGSPLKWSAFAVLALLSHIFLDLLNGGAAIWSPFSDGWASLADLPVVDPLTLAPLIAYTVLARPPSASWRVWRREETPAKPGRRRRARKAAGCCLLFIAAAIALRLGLS